MTYKNEDISASSASYRGNVKCYLSSTLSNYFFFRGGKEIILDIFFQKKSPKKTYSVVIQCTISDELRVLSSSFDLLRITDLHKTLLMVSLQPPKNETFCSEKVEPY